MPVGLHNAPVTFQRLTERCMGEFNQRYCLIYLEDIIVFSLTFEEHVEWLNADFQCLEMHNLKYEMQADHKKCEI